MQLTVARAVRVGHSVTLGCDYDLEGAPLYSVKWYKDGDEFYRYVPKEEPPTRVFPLPELHVDVSIYPCIQINAANVVYQTSRQAAIKFVRLTEAVQTFRSNCFNICLNFVLNPVFSGSDWKISVIAENTLAISAQPQYFLEVISSWWKDFTYFEFLLIDYYLYPYLIFTKMLHSSHLQLHYTEKKFNKTV